MSCAVSNAEIFFKIIKKLCKNFYYWYNIKNIENKIINWCKQLIIAGRKFFVNKKIFTK